MTNPDQDLIDMIAKATPDTPVNDDHRDALRRQVLDAYDQRETDTEPEHPPVFKFTGATFMKFAASIALFAAVGFLAVTALSPSKAIAFEDVAREILKIDTASFEIASTITHADGTAEDEGTFKCVTRMPNLLRGQMPEGDIMIIDFAKDKMLMIDPKKKAALMMDQFFEFTEDDNIQKNLFGEVQEHLRNAEKGGDFGEIVYENLGEKKVNGVQAVGFRVLNPEANLEDFEDNGMSFNVLDIWADAKTGGPVQLEFIMNDEGGSQVKSTFKNFVYNQELDPKLFSFEAPEGYELIKMTDPIRIGQVFGDEGEIGELIAEANKEAEKLADNIEANIDDIVKQRQNRNQRPTSDNLIDALRDFSQHTGGKLPETLDSGPMIDAMIEAWQEANPGKPIFNEDDTAKFFDNEQLERDYITILTAAEYLGTLTGSGGSYTYRGKGVNVDDERTPVLWLKSAGATAYTVIYNDFSVLEMNVGPDDQ